MTQLEIRKMASEMVGDGGTPNKWFVSDSAHIFNRETDQFELMEDCIDEVATYGPFDTYEEALEKFHEIDLDAQYGIGQVIIEDRENGTVTEKYLEQFVRIDYVERNSDWSKRFYKK